MFADPREQFTVAKALRAEELEHSHPGTPSRPSEEDIRLALTPGVSPVIVSLASAGQSVARSFKISAGAVLSRVKIWSLSPEVKSENAAYLFSIYS